MSGNGQSPQTASNGTGAPSVTSPLAERAPAVMALDNLIRRRLRVSDPTNAGEIAAALNRAYPSEQAKLYREERGLPFATGGTADVGLRPPALPVRSDENEVLTDLDRDLRAVLSSTLLAEIKTELRAWATGIRSTFTLGVAAARQGIDPRERERVFASRRTLAEYSRLVRFAGALTPDGAGLYRQLARTVDDAGAVILVALGEALASVGQVGSRFLLQTPMADMQARRDAVIAALRGLVGIENVASTPDGWPRGVLALRQVTTFLRTNGYGDLEPLLTESHLAQQLDSLVEGASTDDPANVGALAPAAQPTLNGLRRLVLVSRGTAFPQSPTLEAFRVALQHFIDPFEPAIASSGYRIPFMARPPLLLGRLAGIGAPDVGTNRLVDLARLRSRLCDEIDHYLEYDVANNVRVVEQVLLDACLQCFDAAIDLYALGTNLAADGAAEWRASAYGYLAYVVRNALPGDPRAILVDAALREMHETLVYWVPPPHPNAPAPLPPAAPPGPIANPQYAIGEELALQRTAEERWFDAARGISPSFVLWARGPAAAPVAIPGTSPVLPYIDIAQVMAGAPVVPTGFVTQVPRDVPSILHPNFP